MFTHIFISFLIFEFGCAQVDGEFWWLNDKFASYAGARPPQPKFEHLSNFDNDENARIIFKDDNLLTNSLEMTENTGLIGNPIDKGELSSEVTGHNRIKWPDEDKAFYGNTINSATLEHLTEDKSDSVGTGDRLVFKFPKGESVFIWKELTSTTTETSSALQTEKSHTTESNKNSTVLYNDKVSFIMHYKEKLSENICTYMKKSDCYQSKGVLKIDMKDQKKHKDNIQLICCVLPLQNKSEDIPPKIYFPDTITTNRRVKRSKDLKKQSNTKAISKRKHAHLNLKAAAATRPKIDDYEYEDPYSNIKNHKNSNKQKQEPNMRYDYHGDEYFEDYAGEIPRPGLTGIYSSKTKDTGYAGTVDYDDDASGFGYSTIDPRIGSDTKRKSKPRVRPVKLTTASDEATYDAETQTISYNSNPDFNVLQNFKLTNLQKKKIPKISRSTTTESLADNDSKESLINDRFDSSEAHNDEFDEHQIYKTCGKTAKPVIMKNKGKQISDTENGTHPWLAVLVPTKNMNNLLCYASLIHPKAGITAGECVYRKPPGELTLIVGLWNLNERSKSKRRVVSSFLHPKFNSGELNNNLALLHWKHPFKVGINIHPICLANPHFHHECMFVGWGGFDQAIRTRSRWQRATVHTCKDRITLKGTNVPNEAFCASVKARSTVTGIGGSLICRIDGHLSAVGVAVSRESTLVLLPAYDWVTSLNIEGFIGAQPE